MLAALTLLVSWSSNNRIDDREMYMNRADMCGILLSCAHICLFFILIIKSQYKLKQTQTPTQNCVWLAVCMCSVLTVNLGVSVA